MICGWKIRGGAIFRKARIFPWKRNSMAKQNNQQAVISVEEILKTELIVNQALIDILIDKKIISEEELIANIRKIKEEQLNRTIKPTNIIALEK